MASEGHESHFTARQRDCLADDIFPQDAAGAQMVRWIGMQVVAIDMRGYGESDRPESRRAYDLSELTKDVSEVIKALGHTE